MTSNDSHQSLGSWHDGDFLGTISQSHSIGAHSDLPDEARFAHGVARVVRHRLAELEARDQWDSPGIAIFLLQPTPPAGIRHARRVPMLDNGLTVIAGRLWFAGAEVVSAHFVELPGHGDDNRFEFVTDIDLGSRPALIFDTRPSTPQLRWYPKGLEDPDHVELRPISGSIDPESVFETIDHLHEQCFVTPSGLPHQVSLWQEPTKHRPQKTAEALVQSHLKAGLLMHFPHCTVRHEQPQVSGRTDIELEQQLYGSQAVVREAVLELKVLRSFTSEGTPVPPSQVKAALRQGVTQAAAYRDGKGFTWSALCCFDMRRDDIGDDQTFTSVDDSAAQWSISLKRWFLYASPEAYRNATYNLP